MKRILITGGSGFIGSTLARQLLEFRKENNLDFEIRAIDILRPQIPEVECRQGSILDISDLSEAARGCDAVVHLAAILGVRNSETRRLDCLNINIVGTVNVLNACVQDRVKKFIFASSSEVYGDQRVFPIKETNPLNPKSVYAVSKLAGEEYVRATCGRYAMDYSILRFFNVYGPGQVGQFVVPRFIMAVQNDKSPEVYGSGDRKRSFCYAEDVTKGILKALFSDKANGETFNIGNDSEMISILDLANKIIQISGKSHIKPVMVAQGASDRTEAREIFERSPDISKARSMLGYEPSCSLENGLRMMYEHGAIVPNWSR